MPFQDANRSLSAKRWMSPTSASSRAAPVGPMPGQVHQNGAAVGDKRGEFLLGGLDLAVDGLELTDQLDHDPAPGLAGQVSRFGRGDQGSGLRRGQEPFGTTGKQLQQQPMQPVDCLGAGPSELVAAVDEQTHHDQVAVDFHPP